MLKDRLDILRPILSRVMSLQAAVAWGLGLGVLALTGLLALHPYTAGPRQPIPFSHYRHAGIRQISCFFCHDGADRSPTAGMPAIAKCLLCHSRIIPDHPEIRKLRAAYESGQAVEWVRVNTLPRFVYFVHEAHLRVGFDCGRCHGDVAGMDRVQLVHSLKMGFCVQCHRDESFSHDCTICHR